MCRFAGRYTKTHGVGLPPQDWMFWWTNFLFGSLSWGRWSQSCPSSKYLFSVIDYRCCKGFPDFNRDSSSIFWGNRFQVLIFIKPISCEFSRQLLPWNLAVKCPREILSQTEGMIMFWNYFLSCLTHNPLNFFSSQWDIDSSKISAMSTNGIEKKSTNFRRQLYIRGANYSIIKVCTQAPIRVWKHAFFCRGYDSCHCKRSSKSGPTLFPLISFLI